MFLGLDTAVQVFSVTTSCLVRTLQPKNGHRVVGYRLSADQAHLYLFDSNGSISKWEWISGKQISSWKWDRKVLSVDSFVDDSSNTSQLVSYSLRKGNDGKREIFVHALSDERAPTNVILESHMRINDLKVAQQGRVVVASGGSHVLIGAANAFRPSTVESLQYTWREVSLPANVTCLDIRESESSVRSQSSGGRKPESIDLILGQADGSILIYHNALSSNTSNKDGRESRKSLAPRRLHWHRGPVNAVRWSRDGMFSRNAGRGRCSADLVCVGNYILSGGNEPVMVLWQLDTGRKQFLPHLSSAICNIVVSPTGNLYALKLADNSTMVLSARELQPHATITGLQLCPTMSRSLNQYRKARQSSHAMPAVLHPQHPDQLLVTVPTLCEISGEVRTSTNSPILQTYDIRTNSHVSRQAVARTNATTVRAGPEGSEIGTPDIKHLDVSEDGKWMATVDAWGQLQQDSNAKAPADDPEIFLKFWRWNRNSNLWELVTRIDGPHFRDKGNVPVLDLARRPYTHEFVTIGVDAKLRFWSPAKRQRSGLDKGSDAETPSETWKCRSVLDLQGAVGNVKSKPLSAACITVSEDGSILAVCLPSESAKKPGVTLLIDAQNCVVRYERVGVYSGDPFAARFLERYLIIASVRSVSVWDTVNDIVRVVGLLDLCTATSPLGPQLLAVNPRTRTFAVATQCRLGNKSCSAKCHVRVYDMVTLKLLFQPNLTDCPLALLSDSRTGGYIIMDVASNLRRLGPGLEKTSQTAHSRDLATTTGFYTGLANHLGSRAQDYRVQSFSQLPAVDADKSVAAQTTGLASVFDVPSFVLPPASVLFRDVVESILID